MTVFSKFQGPLIIQTQDSSSYYVLPHSVAVPGHAYCTVEVVDSINEVALSSTTSQSNSGIS
jgi:hypothetical protein